MKNKVGIVFMIAGVALITSALLLILYNIMEDNRAGHTSGVALTHLQQTITGQSNGDSHEMIVKEIDGYGYIGYLTIPNLELELPIMSDWDDERLKIAPCRQFGSTKGNNLVIAGHNYTRHFGTLSNLQTDDILMFTDMEGVVITYTVESIEVIAPTAVNEVKHSGWDLTLYTCTYGGKDRVTVNCERLDETI